MPAIQSVQPTMPAAGAARDRIKELKERASGSLDNAMEAVTRNLGRREAAEAESSLEQLDLSSENPEVHSLNHAKVLDLISDPFEDA